SATDLGGLVKPIVVPDLTIADFDDQDWFSFELPTPGTARDVIRVRRGGFAGLVTEVWSADRTLLLQVSGDQSVPGGTDTLSLEGLPAGAYRVRIYSVTGAPARYELDLDADDRSGVDLVISRVTAPPVIRPTLPSPLDVVLANYGSLVARHVGVDLVL